MSEEKKHQYTDEFVISGDAVVNKVKELIREGNVRRISLKYEDGRTLLEIPLTLGLIGAALLPVYAAIGAVAALAVNLRIVVERRDQPGGDEGGDTQPQRQLEDVN